MGSATSVLTGDHDSRQGHFDPFHSALFGENPFQHQSTAEFNVNPSNNTPPSYQPSGPSGPNVFSTPGNPSNYDPSGPNVFSTPGNPNVNVDPPPLPNVFTNPDIPTDPSNGPSVFSNPDIPEDPSNGPSVFSNPGIPEDPSNGPSVFSNPDIPEDPSNGPSVFHLSVQEELELFHQEMKYIMSIIANSIGLGGGLESTRNNAELKEAVSEFDPFHHGIQTDLQEPLSDLKDQFLCLNGDYSMANQLMPGVNSLLQTLGHEPLDSKLLTLRQEHGNNHLLQEEHEHHIENGDMEHEHAHHHSSHIAA
ncbi:hypothetical protein HDU97_008335 [Phlyctochytrium planicorne]|nr:hypothetical protein HDU97_008335 [Phlyctochytrium planicorne]